MYDRPDSDDAADIRQRLSGAASGALDTARDYVQTTTRPWQSSNVEKATDDPYILEHSGLLHSDLAASLAVADQAGTELGGAIGRGYSLTKEERTKAAFIYAAALNVGMTHIAITASVDGSNTTWMEKVTDAEYGAPDPLQPEAYHP